MVEHMDDSKANLFVMEDFRATFSNFKEYQQEKEYTFLMENLKKPIRLKTSLSWLNKSLEAYYHYLQEMFLKEISATPSYNNQEEILIKQLREILKVSTENLRDLEKEMERKLAVVGWYGTFKKYGPYFLPYIWKKEEVMTFDVEMPHSIEAIHVHFMEDFIVKGWLSFFPKNKIQVEAFVVDGEIYCLKEAYEPLLNKPQFQISLLKHETQHLLDSYFHLDDLRQEYRGKLVELYYYSDISFLETILNARNLPQAENQQVAGMILRDLQQYLLEVGIYNPLAYLEESTHSVLQWVRNRGTIQQAALAILDRDTQKLLQQTS